MNLMDINMNKNINSDLNPTMVASRTFDNILYQIQSSNLNFQLQISPFSANISLKRSPVKDRSGYPICPPVTSTSSLSNTSADAVIKFLESKILELESSLESLSCAHKLAVRDSEAANQKVKLLAANHSVKLECNEIVLKDLENQNFLVESLWVNSEENKAVLNITKNQSEEIQDSVRSIKHAKEAADRLNKKLCNTKKRFEKEKVDIIKWYKAEIKGWKKDLGEERRQKVKLEEKLNDTHTLVEKRSVVEKNPEEVDHYPSSKTDFSEVSDEIHCTICASPIMSYVPKYFLVKKFRPFCENCDENYGMSDEENSLILSDHPVTRTGFNYIPTFISSNASLNNSNCSHENQCFIRQPFPPPLPAMTPLVTSLYYMKTVAGELDWGSTCWYCMRIHCHNYGCESCVWMKHFGDLHGYPDINPSEYKQHLWEL